MVPLRITTTVVNVLTSTAVSQLVFSIVKTMSQHRYTHQDLYQSTPVIVPDVKIIPLCTHSMTVTQLRPKGGVTTSTVDVIIRKTATKILYSTYTSTTTSTLTLGPRVEYCATQV